MKFYKLGEIPIRSDDQVFKASRLATAIPFIVFLGIGIGCLLYEKKHAPSLFIYGYTALFAGLFTLCAFGQFRASLQPANWLLRCNSSGLIIKYRSYLNWRFSADDVQAVGFEYAEIAWARITKEWRTSPGTGETRQQIQHFTYLDICLANADTSALEAHLQSDQKLLSEEANSNGKWLATDCFVEVLPGGIVRVRWSGNGSFRIGRAIEYLGRHVKIAAEESTKTDLAHKINAKPGDEDAKILALIKNGDKMGAVKLTRQTYGSSLSEAVAFVEKLQLGDGSSTPQ